MDFGIGAGMIVNESGWFVTAGHILMEIHKLAQQAGRTKGRRQKPNDVTNYVTVFGTHDPKKVTLTEVEVQGEVDIGVGKLDGYIPPPVHKFPRFRRRDVAQGELLCRVGYPFVDDIGLKWSNERFQFTNLFPVPQFANEALVSRFIQLPTGRWIETSSPGLRGQSGGPLVDADGYICGIQVNTHHYPLGFRGGGRNQVLNVGRAVHVETVRQFLDTKGIRYEIEDRNHG
jgi:S1-C subfamily serine protease